MARRQRWWSVVRPPEMERPSDSADQYSGQSSDLRAALLRLSHADRLPLVLHFYLDLSIAEVARVLQMSPAAAKSRIYRAAQRLRPELSVEEAL
jgi:RNA polymerase sigma-70 factor, ECF subfamily